MWDTEQKVGLLNDFNLAGFANQEDGGTGQENSGKLTFMALNLLSEEGHSSSRLARGRIIRAVSDLPLVLDGRE